MGNKLTTRFQARFAVTLCALLLVFSAPCDARGSSPDSGTSVKTPVEQAIDLLKANEPAEAKSLLVKELALEPSAIAYANLAAAELALKNEGEAAYAFELSLALGGFSKSEAFRQNLQQGLPAELRSLSDGPLRKIFQPVHRLLPDNAFAGISLAAGLMALLLGLGFFFGAGFAAKSWSKLALFGLLVLFGLSLVLAKAQSNYRNPQSGVVMQSTQLYKAPSEQSDRVRSIPEGAVVSIGELLNDTYRVTLPTGVEGWIPEGDIRVVKAVNLP
ncbi:MAG: SH3 domain-containing protein [Saprospiraceae bacterium]